MEFYSDKKQIDLEVQNREIESLKKRKVSSLGTITLSRKLAGKRVKVVEYVDGSFKVEVIGK